MSKTQQAIALALVAVLCWSGNWVVGRSVRAEVPPMGLNFWRWSVAVLLLTPFALPGLIREWAALRAGWKPLVGLGVLGATMFQSMVYLGLQTTEAINALLLNATGPIFTIVIARIILRDRVTTRQVLGIAISFLGVAWLVLRGDLQMVQTLGFAVGDIWIVAAMFVWGLYSVLLRYKPQASDLTIVYAIGVIGAAFMAPLWIWELAQGIQMQMNRPTGLSVAYVAVFASIIAFLSFNASVAVIGPTKAVTFLHFMPVFGSIMAIVFLGERLAFYHLTGFPVVMLGVLLATTSKRT